MTIPKNAGLSRLAEAASPIEYYPIKKKGQPRRLRPNLDAIRYLEAEQEQPTEIFELYDAGEAIPGSFVSEYKIQRANGWYDAKRDGMYPRPMFQTFDLVISSSNMVPYLEPCPDCDDWSRTSKCEEHFDDGSEGLRKGADRRAARNERRNGPVTVYSDAPTDGGPRGIVNTLLESYRQFIDDTEARFYDPQAEQIEERDRQERATARYVDSQMRRSGCTCSMCTGSYVHLSSVPEELLGPTRDTLLERVQDLSRPFTMTLEITGDTTQASASMQHGEATPRQTVRIEVERNDDTTT